MPPFAGEWRSCPFLLFPSLILLPPPQASLPPPPKTFQGSCWGIFVFAVSGYLRKSPALLPCFPSSIWAVGVCLHSKRPMGSFCDRWISRIPQRGLPSGVAFFFFLARRSRKFSLSPLSYSRGPLTLRPPLTEVIEFSRRGRRVSPQPSRQPVPFFPPTQKKL